ncbi:hypothetical protein GCM10029963_53400 [Micromonospora andamanensis]|uniref:hypothetical protein n=1 Tax=Micromonospora andamanensis TaxID=1287068 RepID=UPI00194E77B2|nr:hypothetical protein [Micromonospora andamanensis]GIJ36703.1 hypothetical protein Vwe01_00280 [Micromonospora andamanensis]
MTTPTASPTSTTPEVDDATAETILYGQALDVVIAERDQARRQCRSLEDRTARAWARVDELHLAVTAAEARADRYRHQLDLANTERARLAEEVAVLRAAAAPPAVLVCRSCGCHDLLACRDGRAWATADEQVAAGVTPTGGPLCTACLVRQAEVLAEQRRPRWRRWFGV